MIASPAHESAGLKADRDRFVGFAFSTAQLLVEVSPQGIVLFASGAACGLAKGSAAALVGRRFADLVDPSEREFFDHVLRRVQEKMASQLVRLRFVTVDGAKVEFMLGGRRLNDDPGSLYFGLILAAGIDLSSSSGGFERIEDLTKAATNRLTHAGSTGNDEGMTLFVIDELATLSETLAPDVLKSVLRQIQVFLRSVSVAGNLVGAIGPGKFGLVRAQGVSDEEIRDGVTQILSKAGIESGVQAFDLAFDAKGLGEADAARALAYSIRRFAEGAAENFNLRTLRDGANEILRDTIHSMENAKKVMAAGLIDVVYQPIVNLATGQTHHVEALSRISGVSSIQAWIGFMEETGLVAEFDLTLAHKVLETLSQQNKAGWRQQVAINLSARSLQSELFRNQFDHLLDRYKPVAGQILIELTETASISDYKALAVILLVLQKRGHKICLDDVGAGETSFETLRALPADFFKVDGSIMRAALTSKTERGMLNTIADLALQKKAELIVEQIETAEQAQLARTIGAKYGQGYLFGQPTVEAVAFSKREKKGYVPEWQPITR